MAAAITRRSSLISEDTRRVCRKTSLPLVQKVTLTLACKNLPNADVTSESDLCAVFYMKVKDKFKEYARTEVVKNTRDPQFTKAITVDYHFQSLQRVRVRIYDIDNSTEKISDNVCVGHMECTLGQIVSKTPFSKVLTSDTQETFNNCCINITTEASTDGRQELAIMKFRANKLDKKDILGKSDPFMEIARARPDESWQTVYKTEVVMNNLDPEWRPFTLSINSMFGSKKDKLAKFTVIDWDDSGTHDHIGSFTCSFEKLCEGLNSEVTWPCINKRKGKKSSYRDSGKVTLSSLKIERVYSFLEFLLGGLQINLTFGVDFTASNHHPQDPTSLHHLDDDDPTEYMRVICAVGDVLQDYCVDNRFPAYGFGAKIPPQMEESSLFPLNLNTDDPVCDGVEQVLDAYENCVRTVELWEPTNVAPIIQCVAESACSSQQREWQGSALTYHILLLIINGVVSDMDEMIDALVEASSLPLSLIIVGVGDANFWSMDSVFGHDGVLTSTTGKAAMRDMVQFVPFKDFKEKLPSEFACRVLLEIPRQVTAYYQMRGMVPNHTTSF